MREKDRIKRICDKLCKLWEENPDCRFYQMLINEGIIMDSNKWHIEDDVVERHIDTVSKKEVKKCQQKK